LWRVFVLEAGPPDCDGESGRVTPDLMWPWDGIVIVNFFLFLEKEERGYTTADTQDAPNTNYLSYIPRSATTKIEPETSLLGGVSPTS